MKTNRENATPEVSTAGAPNEAPLTWTAKKEWGSEGNTHRASIELPNGDTWHFVADQPRKGYWVVRGWLLTAADKADGRTGGDMKFYREDRTVKGAKSQAQAHANLAATQTCDECGRVAGHKLDCGTGWRTATDGVRVVMRDVADAVTTQVAPAVATATQSFRQLGHALNRKCGCPTPTHTMRCGEGAKVRVVRKAGA